MSHSGDKFINQNRKNFIDIMQLIDTWGTKPKKRIHVGKLDRKALLKYQGGKCANCRKPFAKMRVRPILHHKNLNPKDNRLSNIILVCSNCHDRIHQKAKKVVRVRTNALGFKERRVVKVGVRKKKRGRKPKTRRKKVGESIFTGKPIYRRVKAKKRAKKSTIKKRKRKRRKPDIWGLKINPKF